MVLELFNNYKIAYIIHTLVYIEKSENNVTFSYVLYYRDKRLLNIFQSYIFLNF